MRWILMGLAAVVIVVGGWIAWAEWKSTAVSFIPYTIIEADGPFEVRRYPPLVLVSVDVDGDYAEAYAKGFEPLADFVGGDNKAGDALTMTRPVLLLALPPEGASDADPEDVERWRVSFVMPSWFTTGTLPQPNSDALQFAQLPAITVAAATFSGVGAWQDVEEQNEALEAFVAGKGLEAAGPARFAIYQRPFNLPFMRHNDLMIPLQEPQ